MPLRPARRTALNERLRQLVEDETAENYVGRRARMRRVLNRMAERDGWEFHHNEETENWALSDLGVLARSYVVNATRDPARQAYLESRGEIEPGENQYEQTRTEYIYVTPNKYDRDPVRDDGDQARDMLEAVGLALRDAADRFGTRPPRLRDVEVPRKIRPPKRNG